MNNTMDTRKKRVPFIAIGANELGKEMGPTANCPKCGWMHVVDTVRSKKGTTTLSTVTCPLDMCSYLVGVDGREVEK
jgi:hypothetical protein